MATSYIQIYPNIGLGFAKSCFRDTTFNWIHVVQSLGHFLGGQKICMRVHEGFAYLYITSCGEQSADYCIRFNAILEKAQSAVLNHQQNILHTSCIDKYGYSSEKEHFHMFYHCSPSTIHKATCLLLRGTSVNKSFHLRTFHLPNPLQLFSDYICCPMTSINIAVKKFKKRSKGRKNLIRGKKTIVDTSQYDTSQLKEISTFLTALVTASINTWHKDHIPRMDCDVADTWNPNEDGFITATDDEDDSDDDLIPQFDGSSDKVSDSHKKSDQSHLPAKLSQNAGSFQASGETSKNQTFGNDLTAPGVSDMAWRAGTAGSRIENSQNYLSGSWTQQGLSQKTDSSGRQWHGQSQAWSQQQYQGLPNQHYMPSTYPSQQAPFRSPSPASFQSPPHNPYASPTHQQAIQTPSPSQYQYPPYQSSPSNQSYQQPYQSPSQLPHNSPQSSHVFHSSQPYNSPSPHQPYHSPSASQSYQLPGAVSQPYQSLNKPSTTGNQVYQQSQSAGSPYHSSQGNPYHAASGQIYHSPYQSASHPQPHPKAYQSPSNDGCYPTQPAWSPQGYSSYNHRPISNHGSDSQSRSEKHLDESSHSEIDIQYKHAVNPASNDPGSFFGSLGIQPEEQTTFTKSAKRTGARGSGGTKVQPKQKTNDKKRKRNAKTCELKSPESYIITKSSAEMNTLNNANMPLISQVVCSQSDSQDDIRIPHSKVGDDKLAVISNKKSLSTVPVTKISTLEFKPNVTLYSAASFNKESFTSSCKELLNSAQPSEINTGKNETGTSTPMIQQLLMEEPVRMNIKEEAREAALKKPMASPIPPKPKRKYKKRVKKMDLPPSTNLLSPLPTVTGHCGFSPQPTINPRMIGPPGRSHSVSLPFPCDSRMPSPMHNYGWHNWKQDNLPPSSQWQEQQQWRMNDWQSLDSSVDSSCDTVEMHSTSGMGANRLQQRSFSVDAIQSNFGHKTVQPNHTPLFTDNQNSVLNTSVDILQPSTNSCQITSSRESVGDKSYLSSLFQLVSEVGSDDTSWESSSVSVLPNIFTNSSDSETPVSYPVLDINQESPSTKDFITLETPCKQECKRTTSDTTHKSSPNESDPMHFDLFCELKSKIMSRSSFNLGSIQPRVGKQNRAMRLGFLQPRNTDLSCSAFESNPAYTYTFHVPTTVFKKLKFFRGAESRKHNIKVVRMHPMDARRYSLLKIGREIVKAVKLTEADLANYNITLPSPYQFVSADGSSTRVNLDIPTVSVDKQGIDNSDDKIIFSKFDTDFPPNKVAPPSSFHGSQVMARVNSRVNHHSSVDSNWVQQFTSQQTADYKGGVSPGSQLAYSPQEVNFPYTQQQGERSVSTDLQQMNPDNINSNFNSQLPENSYKMDAQQFNQKRNHSYSHSAPSSVQEHCYPNQQGLYTNHQLCPQLQQQQHYQQQQYQVQQEHQQAGSSSFEPEPKNGLRSPGQHGLASTIEDGSIHDQSGDEEVENTTKSSHFNTRVNAHRWDNHAEHMATTAADNTNVYSSPQLSGCLDTIEHLNENQDIVKEKQLTPRASPCHYSFDNEDSLSVTSESSCDNHKTEVKGSKCTSDNCDDVRKPSSEMCNIKKHDNNTSFISHCDKHQVKMCWRKNIKALILTIPKPQSNINPLNLDGVQTASDCMGRNTATLKESGGSEEVNSKYISSPRRSMRSTKFEDLKSEVQCRHSSRQAKLRSVYSKCPHNLKSKRRKKRDEGSLIEGVHYIVVGKFRGHQTMLVKIKKLTVSPKERVRADLFEKLAAKEIIRMVAPVNSLTQEMNDEKSEHTNYLSSTSGNQSDTETHNLHFKNENPDFCHHPSSRSRSYQNASRGRSRQNVKFRSAAMSSVKTRKVLKETHSLRNNTEPKNVLAGPTSGASENNVQSTYFIEDKFFFTFKENFIKHYEEKEQTNVSELKNHENVFFEGIRTTNFHNFQQKFMANVQKLESGHYSSSSDDEDDILDTTIFKEKINIPHTLGVLKTALSKSKHGHFAAKGDFMYGQHAVNNAVMQCTRNEFEFYDMPKTSDGGHRNESALVNDNGSHAAQKGTKDSSDIATYNGIQYQSEGWNNRFFEREDSGRQSLKENKGDCEVSTKFDCKNVKFSDRTKMESSVHRPNYPGNPILCSARNPKQDEEKEDYLKCQMAFFEDISSDSDTNDTIITDTYMGKENVLQGYSRKLYPPFSITTSCTDKFISGTTKGVFSQDNNELENSQGLELCKRRENSEIYNTDLTFKNVELPGVCRSYHSKPQMGINDSKHGDTSETLDISIKHVSGASIPESQDDNLNIAKRADQQKDTLHLSVNNLLAAKDILSVSECAVLGLAKNVSVSAINSGVVKHLKTSKVVCPYRNETMDEVIDSHHNNEARMFIDYSQRHKKCGKSLKISKRNRESKLYKRKQSLHDRNLSSNDETGISLVSVTLSENKCLHQRKRARPTCVEELGVSEDDTSCSSNEKFNTNVLQHKGSRNNKQPKGEASKGRVKRKLPQVSMDAGRAIMVHPSRGRRKKPHSGDKLLSSLSLLHMATLANLTEAQTDPPDGELEMATLARREKKYMQHSVKSSKDYSTSSSGQDQTFSPSPYNPPVVKKSWKHTRCVENDTSLLPMSNLKFSKRPVSLKSICIGTANVCSQPLPFIRHVSNFTSSSPVPSNFMFSHISDSSNQPDATNSSQDVSTCNTPQLLETRRAQVNCTSFSMKDILKLTTPDDSVDSDSKDSVALVKTTGSNRAQVKSTTLSMNDILKLTSVDNSSEMENPHTSKSIHSLFSNFDCSKTHPLHKNLKILGVKLSLPKSQTSLEALCVSYNMSNATDLINNVSQSQIETLNTPEATQLTDCNSDPSELIVETTEASPSLLSQMANFQNSSVLENYDADCHVQTASFFIGEKMHERTNEDKKEKIAKTKSISSSDNGMSDSNVNTCSKSQYLGNMKDKHVGDVFKYKHPVISRMKEINHKSSKQNTAGALPSSPGLGSSLDVKCVLKPLSSSPSSPNAVNDSENIGRLERPASTPTFGTILQATGIKSASMSTIEGLGKHNVDSHPPVPSHIHLQLNAPETPITPVLEISKIPLNSDEILINEQLNHRSAEPQFISSKQEKREIHKNLNVRNALRGIKPLHPLQISPYSYMAHGYNSQAEAVQASRNSSLSYPYCWQWPIQASGLDPAVSPLNLCTARRSPNNYSPITPTSPISPNYPTQAQGFTESDLPLSAKNEKPLWYPWLNTDSAKPRTNVYSGNTTRHYYKAQNPRNSRISNLLPSKLNEQGQIYDSICKELNQTELWRVKHDAKMQKLSPNSIKGQLSSSSKSGSLGINNTLPNSELATHILGTVFKATYDIKNGNSPSLSYSDNVVGANHKLLSETSRTVTLKAKLNSRFRKNGGQCSVSDSALWSADIAATPDSLNSYQRKSSSFKPIVSSVNEENTKMSDADEQRGKLYGKVSKVATMSEVEDKSDTRMPKNVKKSKGKFRLSALNNPPSSSNSALEHVKLPGHAITEPIKDDTELEHCHHKTASQAAEVSRSNKLPSSDQKQSSQMLNEDQCVH